MQTLRKIKEQDFLKKKKKIFIKEYPAAIRNCAVSLHYMVNVDDAAENARKPTAQRGNVKSSRAAAHATPMLISRNNVIFCKKA